MASVASLGSELKKLGAQSKRHSAGLAQASDASLGILEQVTHTDLDEKTAIHELRNYDDFVTPFILACSESSAKSCASALQCIQTLATYNGIAPSRIKELLKALMEATQLGLGIQLKILQVLPVILFEFSSDLSGQLLVDLLTVCTELLGSNKVGMVHNTAYATLQQLINGIFDRTELPEAENSQKQEIILDQAGASRFMVKPHLHDSAMVLVDLCNIAEGSPPVFTKLSGLSLTFTLELLELTLSNQAGLIHKYDELASIMRIRVVPLLLRLFAEATEFPIVLRATRLFYLLLRQHIDILTTESEVILSTITQSAMNSVLWKRSLCLEVLQGLFLEVGLLVEIYTMFDKESKRTNIITTIMSDFSRALSDANDLTLVSETKRDKLDRYISANSGNEISDNPENVDNDNEFLLSKACALKIPIIEMLDRVEPPRLNPAYPYYQILKCVNSYSEDIHKLVSNDSKAEQLLQDTSSTLINCYSIALSVSMDLDLFRFVVRAVQRLAHASGIVSVKSARDKFMSLLSQHCKLSVSMPDDGSVDEKDEEVRIKEWVIARCSLCVRALFNLGYALGNQLNGSWGIITSTITVLNEQIEHTSTVTPECIFGNLSSEYSTINSALLKLMQSTTRLNDQALTQFMRTIGQENDPVKYRILLTVGLMNVSRMANTENKSWYTFSGIMIEGIKNGTHSDCVDILHEVASAVVAYASSTESDKDSLDRSLKMIISSLCSAIKATNDMKLLSLQHLNSILEKFGQYISTGWQDVLDVISLIPKFSSLELNKCAFVTLELICSDFSDNLPFSCVFSLTLCLDEFAKQSIDLNTAFTSVSLFWTICDHLIPEGKLVDGTTFDAKKIHSEDDLIKLTKNTHDPDLVVLWLLAVIKLAAIAGVVQQHQVKTSAIQIFLRIFNTHGAKLSKDTWDIAYRMAFPKLLISAQESKHNEDRSELEVYKLVVEGISRIILLFLPQSYELTSFKNFWTQWMHFLDSSAKVSPSIALSAYKNLRVIFESANCDMISRESLYNFWKSQDPLPWYSQKFPKPTADSLKELLGLYPLISSQSDISSVLKLIQESALFPYYTVTVPNNEARYPMSALQNACVETLESIDLQHNQEALSKYLSLLDRLARAPYMDINELKVHPNYSGISRWAQSSLLDLIPMCESNHLDDSSKKSAVEGISSSIIETMNIVIKESKIIKEPSLVILKILALSDTSNEHHGDELVRSVENVLEVSDIDIGSTSNSENVKDTVKYLEMLVDTIQAKPVKSDNWNSILGYLLEYSIFYNRGVHNDYYYQANDSALAEALLFGSTDIPKPTHNDEISSFCLKLLCDLGCQSEKSYSSIASDYFLRRFQAVLFQYIGDCKILGQEPIRRVLNTEITCILEDFVVYAQKMMSVSKDVQELLLRAIGCSHIEHQALLQRALEVTMNAN